MKSNNKGRPFSFISKAHAQGFTFIEMLVVSAMVSIVALAIYATLNNGLRIWQRVNQQLPGEDVNIFLDKFNGDLKNCLNFKNISFLGTGESLSFATLVSSPRLKIRTVGRANYFYDAGSKTLTRELSDFSDIYSSGEGFTKQSLGNVTACKFQFYYYDRGTKKFAWLDEWPGTSPLPLAVRMELELGGAIQKSKFTKTVGIPAAG